MILSLTDIKNLFEWIKSKDKRWFLERDISG